MIKKFFFGACVVMDTKEDSQVYHVPHVSPTGEGRDLVSTLETGDEYC